MIIYIHTDENGVIQGWAGIKSMDGEFEVEIEEDHEILRNHPRMFVYKDGKVIKDETVLLNIARENKDAELNTACQKAIIEGFTHKINGQDYWFSFDQEAQSNFQGTRPLLKEGLIQSINWTVRLGGKDGEYTRIPIDVNIMDELTIAILMHKDRNISRYRDELLPLVYKAESLPEINAINWDYVPPVVEESTVETSSETVEESVVDTQVEDSTTTEETVVLEEPAPQEPVQPPQEEILV